MRHACHSEDSDLEIGQRSIVETHSVSTPVPSHFSQAVLSAKNTVLAPLPRLISTCRWGLSSIVTSTESSR